MQLQNILLIVISTIVILAVWVSGWFFPNVISHVVALVVTCVVLGGAALLYWFLNQSSGTCSPGDPGTCQSDDDCNNRGKCDKDSAGNCACVCDSGYSGLNCETIKWDSPHCMGPNKWPSKKGKDDECLCPNSNWTDGTDPTFGYVQCFKCAGNWGPLAGDVPCSDLWNTATYLSTDCYGSDKLSVACDEYNNFTKYVGPSGQKGTVTPSNFCNSGNQMNSCKCPPGSTNSRVACEITSFLDPNKPSETCENSINERKCSSYRCVN